MDAGASNYGTPPPYFLGDMKRKGDASFSCKRREGAHILVGHGISQHEEVVGREE